MAGTLLAPGTVLRRSKDGSIRRYAPAGDSDSLRGAALAAAVADCEAYDAIDVGTGTYTHTDPITLVADTSLRGSGPGTIITTNIHPRSRCELRDIYFNNESDAIYFQQGVDIDDVTDVVIRDCKFNGLQDCLSLQQERSSGTTIRRWYVYNCIFETGGGSNSNDTIVITADYFHIKLFNCAFRNLSTLDAAINCVIIDVGGPNLEVDVYNSDFYLAPAAQPIDAACVSAFYGATTRCHNCRFHVVTGGFTNVYVIEALTNGAGVGLVELNNCTYDASLVMINDFIPLGGANVQGTVRQGPNGNVRSFPLHAKVGGTAGWVVNAADNKNSLARLPAGQSGSTLVIPINLPVGSLILNWYVVGQIESGGNAVTLDGALRKQTTAAGDLVDAAISGGAIVQISKIADFAMAAANKVKLTTPEYVGADETFYILLTGTTGASCDIDLQSINVEILDPNS